MTDILIFFTFIVVIAAVVLSFFNHQKDSTLENIKAGTGCLVPILLVCIFLSSCVFSPDEKPEEKGISDGRYYVSAKEEVIARLASPSTADFPLLDKSVIHLNGKVIVKSYVDSQNGFGATLRTRFTVTFNEGDLSTAVVEFEDNY